MKPTTELYNFTTQVRFIIPEGVVLDDSKLESVRGAIEQAIEQARQDNMLTPGIDVIEIQWVNTIEPDFVPE